MKVNVLFFGALKDRMGTSARVVELIEKATLRNLLNTLQSENPLTDILPTIAMSVNREYAAPETELRDGDEVALLPPVSGGSAENRIRPPSLTRRSAVVRVKINLDQILTQLKQPSDGAAVVFEGIVRNHTRGRQTLYLEYEAYEEMAIQQMELLIQQALTNYAVRDASIVHRVGRLEIGETSVLIAVASEHRGAAFDACRWLIDTLKQTVPIWKKEYFKDGAVWVDGEPFPPEIPRAGGH